MENPTNATPFNAHMQAWGLTVDVRSFEFVALSDRHESHAIQRYLRRLMLDMQDNGTMPDSDFSNFWYRLFNCFQPAQAKDNPLNLAISSLRISTTAISAYLENRVKSSSGFFLLSTSQRAPNLRNGSRKTLPKLHTP